jgi:hypothetical protein
MTQGTTGYEQCHLEEKKEAHGRNVRRKRRKRTGKTNDGLHCYTTHINFGVTEERRSR